MRFTTAALFSLAACLVAANPIATPFGGTGILEARQLGRCPCDPGLCCSPFGFCGTGPEFCTSPSPSLFLTPPRRKEIKRQRKKGLTSTHV